MPTPSMLGVKGLGGVGNLDMSARASHGGMAGTCKSHSRSIYLLAWLEEFRVLGFRAVRV